MGRKRKNGFDHKCLKSGRFAVVCSASLAAAGHPMTIASLVQAIYRVASDLERIQTRQGAAGSVVVADLEVPLFMKLIIPTSDQGALGLDGGSEPNGESPSSDNRASEMDEETAFSTRKDKSAGASDEAASIEESGLMEAEDRARVSRSLTLASMNAADGLISRAEREQVSLEAATEEFSRSPDWDVARKVYSRARGPMQTIEFPAGERALGGNHKIPSELVSDDTFKLKNCQVSMGAKQRLVLQGDACDEEWCRLQNTYPDAHEIGTVAEGTESFELLRYAHVAAMNADVTVCVQEHPGKRRRSLIPLSVMNAGSIVAMVQARLASLVKATE